MFRTKDSFSQRIFVLPILSQVRSDDRATISSILSNYLTSCRYFLVCFLIKDADPRHSFGILGPITVRPVKGSSGPKVISSSEQVDRFREGSESKALTIDVRLLKERDQRLGLQRGRFGRTRTGTRKAWAVTRVTMTARMRTNGRRTGAARSHEENAFIQLRDAAGNGTALFPS